MLSASPPEILVDYIFPKMFCIHFKYEVKGNVNKNKLYTKDRRQLINNDIVGYGQALTIFEDC